MTLEYASMESQYPGLSFIQPAEFREKFLNGSLEQFDAVFRQKTYIDGISPVVRTFQLKSM